MYNPQLVQPMREELTNAGFKELLTPDQVRSILGENNGTKLLVINSVCGCAAGSARPGVVKAMSEVSKKPDQLLTVFAGQDKEATETARSFLHGYPPSSPSVALLKDGEVIHFIPRQHIEGYTAAEIAENLKNAIEKYC